jgi:hypothetical protein
MSDQLSRGEATALRGALFRGRGDGQRELSGMGAIFNVFPLILIPVLMYNIWAFGRTVTGTSSEQVREMLGNTMFRVPMASSETVPAAMCQSAGAAESAAAAPMQAMVECGVHWNVTGGDVLMLVALILLFVELLKSTSTGTAAIFNHALSMLVFIICLVEFLLHPAFATSVFFMILVMSLLDVLAGVVVTIVSARRDVDFGQGH